MRMLNRLALVTVAVSFCSFASAEESIVFSGYPFAKVESNADATNQYELNDSQSQEYRVLIVKRDGK